MCVCCVFVCVFDSNFACVLCISQDYKVIVICSAVSPSVAMLFY